MLVLIIFSGPLKISPVKVSLYFTLNVIKSIFSNTWFPKEESKNFTLPFGVKIGFYDNSLN